MKWSQVLSFFCMMACSVIVAFPSEQRVRRVVAMEYPDLAVQARMQGTILVECLTGRKGDVIFAKIIQSNDMTEQGRVILGNAVLENIKQWRFQGNRDSQAIRIEYKFILDKAVTSKRGTRFVFDFPNRVHVSSWYRAAMY